MRLIAIASVVVLLAYALSPWQVSEAFELPEEPITLITDVDGKAPVTTLRVTTAGDTDRWTIHADVSWLQVTPTSGIGAQQLTISVVPGVLQPGQHSATLSLRAPGMPDAVIELSDFSCIDSSGIEFIIPVPCSANITPPAENN